MRFINSNDDYIYLTLVDKTTMLFPKRFFLANGDAANFIGLIRSKLIKSDRTTKIQPIETNKSPKIIHSNPPYLLGLLCLIPLIGAFVGLGLFMYGIFRYKDKWLSIIGVLGIGWTVFVYSSLNHELTSGIDAEKGFSEISQMQLNTLVKDIEFYKIQHGTYPDKLKQLDTKDVITWTSDPLQTRKGKDGEYNYKKMGNHYYLFSSGVDGIPNTKDDIYPQIALSDTSKIGLILKK